MPCYLEKLINTQYSENEKQKGSPLDVMEVRPSKHQQYCPPLSLSAPT